MRHRFLIAFALVLLLPGARAAQGAPVSASVASTTVAAPPILIRLRVPQPLTLRLDPADLAAAQANPDGWLTARPEQGDGSPVQLGRRLLLHLNAGVTPEAVLADRPLRVLRALGNRTWLLEAADAWSSVRAATELAALPGVALCYPDLRRQQLVPMDRYAARSDDPFFGNAWHLENRDATGRSVGPDLNLRAAWSSTRGEGVTVAIVDTGVDLGHPEFEARADTGLHRLFDGSGSTNGLPVGDGGVDSHGTAVAGLLLAEGSNRQGAVGVAPGARLASWKIFGVAGLLPSSAEMAEMFQFHNQVVGVQNHSWGNADAQQLPVTQVELDGISNAFTFGREGRGVVMVRAAGNGRASLHDPNDDGYASDPRVIAVAAVQSNGRVATNYSSSGACILVAAPGGGSDRWLFTTDRRGADGFNSLTDSAWGPDYASGTSIKGTSFATPQISGLVALLLSAHPSLTARDVQHVLALSARHFDLADPDVRTNGAGLVWSHNVGFGVPDAGEALALARAWPNRPPLQVLTFTNNTAQAIPDDGLRLSVRVPGLETTLTNTPATPGLGLQPDAPTPELPLIDLGYATNAPGVDLTGKGALIRRGPDGTFPDGRNTFRRKIETAAQAGAVFAVIYNNVNATERLTMADTEFVPIPAVFIDQNTGEALRDLLAQQPAAVGQLRLDVGSWDFPVGDTLVCEHVGVRLRFSHGSRSQLRITVRSPHGVFSSLQRLNQDSTSGAFDWTYYTTQHFLESSAGTWTVAVSDERANTVGSVQGVELILRGVPIVDTDQDGLDDVWEQTNLGTLAEGPHDDPDHDGYGNAREQVMGTPPGIPNAPLRIDVAEWQPGRLRLSWPGQAGRTYELLAAPQLGQALVPRTSVPGRFPVTEWFTPALGSGEEYLRVRTTGP